MQTSREAIDRLLRNKPPFERIGLSDYVWEDTAEKWVREEGYPTDEEGKPIWCEHYFGFDLCGADGGIQFLPFYGEGAEEVVDETDEWKITRNGAGAALKYWKSKSGTPEHVDFKMISRKIWERDYRPQLLVVDRSRLDIEETKKNLQTRREEGFWTHYGLGCVWETMRCSMGDICMFESLVLDPAWIHDFNRVYTDFYKAHFKILIEEAGVPDGMWIYEDLGYRNGLYCSPKVLEELIFPYYSELVAFFHSYNLPVVLHACGNISEAVPLVVEAGFDALNPMEVKAGCDIFSFAEKYADKLAFIGGLDARILESGDEDVIRTGVSLLIEGMKKRRARYVFGSDHSISTNVTLASMKFAHEVYREHMYY